MNFRIKEIFHYVSAWQLCFQPDVMRDGCGVAVCRSIRNGLPDKKLKYYYVNVNYTNISYYILFVFIIY